MLGADPDALRTIGMQLSQTADKLTDDVAALGNAIASSSWSGSDAESFKGEWQSIHSPRLIVASAGLKTVAEAVRRNADEQEEASNGDAGGSLAGIGSLSGIGSLGGLSLAALLDGNGFELGDIAGFAAGIPSGANQLIGGLKALGGAFLNGKDIIEDGIGLKKYADLMKGGLAAVDRAEVQKVFLGGKDIAKMSTAAKFIHGVGGAFSIVSGVHDMISPEHQDGWRSVGDRIAGGLDVISGGASLLMLTPLAVTPAGPIIAGVGLTAGLISAGWHLGNLAWDHREQIGSFLSDCGDAVKENFNRNIDVAKRVMEGAQQAASEVAKAGGDIINSGWQNTCNAAAGAMNFTKGIFGC